MYTTIKSEYFNIIYKDCSPIKGNLKLSYILIYRFSIQIFQIKRQTICKVVKIIKIILLLLPIYLYLLIYRISHENFKKKSYNNITKVRQINIQCIQSIFYLTTRIPIIFHCLQCLHHFQFFF